MAIEQTIKLLMITAIALLALMGAMKLLSSGLNVEDIPESDTATITYISTECETWRIEGLFIDLYTPKNLNDALGKIGNDCANLAGDVDPTLCKNRCLNIAKLLEYCNPDGGGFGMNCVLGGTASVRSTLEGGA